MENATIYEITTNNSVSEYVSYYTRSTVTIWTILFSIITVFGVVGNFTVIWIVMAHKRMRTVTNLLIVNLAFSEGTVALINIPFNAFQVLTGEWIFGWLHCKVNEAFATLCICVSVFSLSVIAMDRFMAIVYPFKMRLDLTKTIFAIVGIWLLSFLVSAPNWIFVTTTPLAEDSSKYYCLQQWPNPKSNEMYDIFFMIMTYFLPVICMLFTYGRVGVTLWRSKVVGEQNKNQVEQQDHAKKKVVKMMILVVLIFMICWLPYQIYFILVGTEFQRMVDWDWNKIYLVVFWLAMSNPVYNPIIYCWLNRKFRVGFKKVFKCLPFVAFNQAEWEDQFSSSS